MPQKPIKTTDHEPGQTNQNDPQNHENETRGIDPNVLQHKASQPNTSVWVSASAGTGKTKVLTDRVLRLLLPRDDGAPGTKTHKILCLTFTKAAASEMALRINKTLSKWAVMNESELYKNLENLLGRTPNKDESSAARKLFAQVVDTPGGLKIMTIHAFCQSVLSRFPLEAGLSPNFTALEEHQATALMIKARETVFASAFSAKGSPLSDSLVNILTHINEEAFIKLLQGMSKERHQLSRIIERHKDIEGLYTQICQVLNIRPGITEHEVTAPACAGESLNEPALRTLCAQMSEGGKHEQTSAPTLANWLDSAPETRIKTFANFKSIFLTTNDTPRHNFPTKSVREKHPDAETTIQQQTERLLKLAEHTKRINCASLTRGLFHLGYEIIKEYQKFKSFQSLLDFDDLILHTLNLLEKSEKDSAWVLYKLDQGLDHILIDEAQDTNPEQWSIVEALTKEFFTGLSARANTTRTIFTVGDEKQSIYSFQRASPEEFTSKRKTFKSITTKALQQWDDVDLNISFRSAKTVLDAVDIVFENPQIKQGLGDSPIKHISHRTGQEGIVELWPLYKSEESKTSEFWDPPITQENQHNSASQLANDIADKIKFWINNERLPTRDRTIKPGDILILVRTRNAFVNHMIRSLKSRQIPVSGADRMVLGEQLAIEDLCALASCALNPQDDLTLACVLKSPLISLTEDQLYDLAIDRSGSLWNALKNSKHTDIKQYLSALITRATNTAPFEFFSSILQTPCPADKRSGLRAILNRLGDDALDPLDELLNEALNFEKENIPSLQVFLHKQEQTDNEIKREMDETGNKVRIMTIHGAKGLQAPIVIMPDTVRAQRHVPEQSDKRLLWPNKTDLPVPLWSPRKDDDPEIYAHAYQQIENNIDEEYRRLLYVAMTRAEDRLYIAGYYNSKKPINDSWYEYIRHSLENASDCETLEDGTLRLHNNQTKDPDKIDKNTQQKNQNAALPNWLFSAAPKEQEPPTPLTPSRPSESEPESLSPLQSKESYRFKRGNLTHKLLQFLPDLKQDQRQAAAQSFLERHAQDLPQTTRKDIAKETLEILGHPDFAPLFAAGSMAEVPITGLLPSGKIISGQIDRLLITKSEILIIDYKTNRPPPANPKNIPLIYQNQMQAYRETLEEIYPDRTIKCAILWTDGPRLVQIKV